MSKHFINTKAGANKFWSVTQKGKTIIIRFGRIGTAGRELKKSFASNTAAKEAAMQLMQSKTAKGYKAIKASPAVLQPVSSFSPINKQTFWKIINASLQYSSLQKQANYLEAALKKLSQKDLAGFQNIFNRLENAAYSWKLWAAAYTIHAGCSDDSFADFRAWLITRGQSVYEKAIASPDSLCKLDIKKLNQSKDGERFLYLAPSVYEDLYDDDISNDKHTKSFKRKTKPSGKEWNENDLQALIKINPSLFKLFKKKWLLK